jgi:integrase
MTLERSTVYDVEDGLASERTKERYRVAFRLFLEYCQCDSHSLLDENPRRLEDRIIGYIRFLDQVKHQARGTINISVCAIFHYFEMNDIVLNKRKITRFVPPNESVKDDRAYTHEEIAQILLHCDERARMMILLMASTGMRIGALDGIKLGHLENIEEYHLYKIQVYANSQKDRYYTFCTPECAAAIDSYLTYRQRFGDPLKKTSPLIREQFDIYDKLQCTYPKPVSYRGILWIVTNLLERSGFQTKGEIMRSHGLRKFAITQMVKAKVDYAAREYLVGHKRSRGLDVNYDRTSEEDRLAEYLKAVDLLTIDPANRLRLEIRQLRSEHSEEWNALKREMMELKRLIQPSFSQ